MKKDKSDIRFGLLIWIVIVAAMAVAFFFCVKKQGFHYDEYYSYYSTNVTCGLHAADREWLDSEYIRDEFMALKGEPLNLGVVKLNQSFDVHPPMYYYVLRVVCCLSKGVFSKWQGLAVNLVFYFACLLLLWKIADIFGGGNRYITLFTLVMFGLSPGYLSTVTFIRMYVMLTAECFGMLLLHMLALRDGGWNIRRVYLPVAALTFIGFLTHYYFMIFMFFLAAFTCIKLVIRKETRKSAFAYGFSVCLAMGLAVLYYPSCLSHMFSGYRGVEATQAFADMSNTAGRINFFVQLLNDYTFSGLFYILALVIILLYVFCSYKKKVTLASKLAGEQQKGDTQPTAEKKDGKGITAMVIFVTLCYFLVVCKTGMMPSNPPEALRYECPVYGLIILIVVWGIFEVFAKVTSKQIVATAVLLIAVGFQIYGLCADKVFFVYEDAADNVAYASQRSSESVVYIYNPNNEWMIWNDSAELMQYDNIYFVSMLNTDSIVDEKLLNADTVYVYTCRCDEAGQIMNSIVEGNDRLSAVELDRQRLYADIYVIR